MTSRWIARAMLLLSLACAGSGWAAITCTVSSAGWSAAYVPSNPGFNITQAQVVVECRRNLAGDPTSVSYNIQVNNGVNATGNANRLRLGATGNYLTYENYRDSACGGLWKQSTPQRITGTITGLTGFLPISQVTSYWGCIDAGQLGGAAGTYTDLVTMTMSYGSGTATGTFPISVYSPASCTVTNPPGTITFSYTAFGAAVNASTPFGVTCTNQLPYTMSLDATTGIVLGLEYTLSFSAASAVGTGVQQNHSINGVMAAGQAGACTGGSCTGNQTRTLTITY